MKPHYTSDKNKGREPGWRKSKKKKKHICTSCDKLTNAPLASGHSFLPQLARTFHAHSHNVSKVNLQTTTWRSNYMTPKLRSCKRLCTKSSETMHITTLFTDIAAVANKKTVSAWTDAPCLLSSISSHRPAPPPNTWGRNNKRNVVGWFDQCASVQSYFI